LQKENLSLADKLSEPCGQLIRALQIFLAGGFTSIIRTGIFYYGWYSCRVWHYASRNGKQ